jgi:hypothetical protein
MTVWWESLTAFDKTLWAIAIPSLIIFILQTVMTFLGMDSHSGDVADFNGDMQTDAEPQPFQLFTFRNFINFLLGFSWTAIALNPALNNQALVVLFSTISGIMLVAAVMFLFYSMSKMTEDGTMVLKNAINQTGLVYLRIPGEKNGVGKVHVKVQGTLRELDAMTSGQTIETGKLVKVVDIINDDVLLVIEI